jgi:hypothetical protein
MRLRLESVGGFAGRAGREVTSLDLDKSSSDRAGAIRHLVSLAKLPTLPSQMKKGAPTPADFSYRLTVDDGDSRTFEFHLDAAPPALRAIVEAIEQARDAGEAKSER